MIEYLDEVAWIDYGFADDYPSDYIFDKEDKEKLSQLLADFIDKRIDKSGHRYVEILETIHVEK